MRKRGGFSACQKSLFFHAAPVNSFGQRLPLGKGSQGVWQFFMGSPLWGRAGAQRLRGGILCISRTSDLLPMFLLKQWPPLRVQPCRFRQKRRISTSSAQCAHWAPSPPGEGLRMRSSSSYYGFLTVSKKSVLAAAPADFAGQRLPLEGKLAAAG